MVKFKIIKSTFIFSNIKQLFPIIYLFIIIIKTINLIIIGYYIVVLAYKQCIFSFKWNVVGAILIFIFFQLNN